MPILVYGLNHQSAPLELRERLAVPEGRLPSEVSRLLGEGRVEEGMILSTCNRIEILVHARAPDAGQALKRFFVSLGRASEEELDRHCYLHADREAVRHLFRVACSLDSLIVGEPQILGQVKEAYTAAHAAGGLKSVLDSLLQRTFSVAKRVRTETGIARVPVSIAHASVVRAREIFGELETIAVLVLGAGKMARLAAQHLKADGAGAITVASRTYQRAAELAGELGATAVSWDLREEQMARADVVLVSTGAPHLIVEKDEVARAARARRGRPIFFLDISVPRNVDPRVGELDNVYLYDLEDLKGVAEAGRREREREAQAAESIVDAETSAYLDWVRSLEVTPTIADLRRHLHALGAAELERFRSRLGPLTPQQQQALEEFETALMNKVLHHPIQALKRSTGRPGGGTLIALLREAFGLDGRGAAKKES